MFLELPTGDYLPIDKVLLIASWPSRESRRLLRHWIRNNPEKVVNYLRRGDYKGSIVVTESLLFALPYTAKIIANRIDKILGLKSDLRKLVINDSTQIQESISSSEE